MSSNYQMLSEEGAPFLKHNPQFKLRSLVPSASENAASSQPCLTIKHADQFVAGYWWWWEVSAASTSIFSMVVLFIMLLKTNGIALDAWAIWLQPNTVISILVTVSKSAVMLVVTACLGQLKWRHFAAKPRPLRNIQVFDEASRGPWGSAKFLVNISALNVTSCLLVLVTLAGLTLEPSAQQLLEFPSRLAVLRNVSAEVGSGIQYDISSNYANMTEHESSQRLALDTLTSYSQVLGAMGGVISDPYFDCPEPATQCSWPEFRTLGVCSTIQQTRLEINMTDCTWDNPKRPTFYSCSYNPSAFENGTGPLAINWALLDDQGVLTGNPNDTRPVTLSFPSIYTSSWSMSFETDGIRGMIAVSPNDTWAWTQSNTTTAQVSLATWRVCEHTFSNLTSDSRALYVSSKTSNPVRGRPYATDDDFLVFVSNSSSSTEYRMSKAGFYALDLSMEAFFGGPGGGVAEEIMSKTLDMDLKTMTENIAAELSSQIRSSSNTNLTSVAGATFSSQVYIRVRWIWLALPVAEVLVTCLALLFTIMANQGQPLLKSSVLALLASDVEQANLKEVSFLFNEDAKRKPMEDWKARFRIGGDGRIVFSNKGGESLSSSPQVQGSDFI